MAASVGSWCRPGWTSRARARSDGRCSPFGTTLDITERKEAEEQIRAREEELRKADRRKSEFLAVLSHELRNPLAPMRNNVQLLERSTADSETARHAREVLRRQTDHLARLVDDLLDITRISHGKIELQLEPVEAGAVAAGVCSDASDLFRERGVELVMVPLLAPHGSWPTRTA